MKPRNVSYLSLFRAAVLRPVVVFTTFTAFLIGGALAEDAKADGKAPPSDGEIADLVGCRLSKVFATFGYPEDVSPINAKSETPMVFLDYSSYGFNIFEENVYTCYYFPSWKGTVFGARMGDSIDELVEKFGKPRESGNYPNGVPYMIWPIKEWYGIVTFAFDKDNKIDSVSVKFE